MEHYTEVTLYNDKSRLLIETMKIVYVDENVESGIVCIGVRTRKHLKAKRYLIENSYEEIKSQLIRKK